MRGIQLRLHLRCPRCRYDLGMRLLHHCDGCTEAWLAARAKRDARLGLRPNEWVGGPKPRAERRPPIGATPAIPGRGRGRGRR